jgi:hypothetical protein
MFVKLTSSTTAKIIQENYFLSHKPRWDVRGCSLVLGAYHDGYEHEHHVAAETFGSTSWFDELRFDKTKLVLSSIYFRVPEENIDLKDFSKVWMEESPLTGLLSLTDPEYFESEPSSFRWFDPKGEVLICINENALSETQDRLRLRVAIDFDLMFSNNQLCGWILSHPLNYITRGWEQPNPIEDDGEIASIVYKYLQLVSEDFLEKMEDEDSDVLEALLDLNRKSKNTTSMGYQREVICECIESIIEQFYGQLVV